MNAVPAVDPLANDSCSLAPRLVRLAPAPAPTRAFVGRREELARILEIARDEVLFVLYGVAGIGKTELGRRALALLSEQPEWRNAATTVVEIRPGMDAHHLLAVLRLRTNAVLAGEVGSLADELAAIVCALNAQPRLVLLDDIHHLDSAAAGQILGWLAHHVHASRVFVTSRAELPIRAAGVTPLVQRLGPLDDSDAAQMLAFLARRNPQLAIDIAACVRQAAGSPYLLRRAVASTVSGARESMATDSSGDDLDDALSALPAAARKLLARLAVLGSRVACDELAPGGDLPDALIGSLLAGLAEQFFIDITGGAIAMHDLVRHAVLRRLGAAEHAEARATAAAVLIRRAQAGGPEGAIAAAEALQHLAANGDRSAAVPLVGTFYKSLVNAGLDHALLGALHELRAGERDAAIDLFIARILARRSRFAEAQGVLDRLAGDPAVAELPRYRMIAGTVAASRGDLRTAEHHLQHALRGCVDRHERARIATDYAYVLALRGEAARARAVLTEARDVCDELSSRARLRWQLSWACASAFVQDCAGTATALAGAVDRALRDGAWDLAIWFAALEIQVAVELLDAARARHLHESLIAPAVRRGSIGPELAGFYAGLTAMAEGDLDAAVQPLRHSLELLLVQHDAILASVVGHYLARVELARGDSARAIARFAASNAGAASAGLDSILVVGRLHQAHALLAARQTREARELAERALRDGTERGCPDPVRAGLLHLLALDHAQRGELGAARRLIAESSASALPPATARVLDLERAMIELCGGDPLEVVRVAGAVRDACSGSGHRLLEANAASALAGGYVVLGKPADLVIAGAALARADALLDGSGHVRLALFARLVRVALATRLGDRAAAQRAVTEALAIPGAGGQELVERFLLACALGSARDHELPAGLAAMLAAFGTTASSPRARILIDLRRASIAGPRGVITGQHRSCAILASLIDSRGEPVAADQLYAKAWDVADYHPLRNRGTLYSAINRVRRALVAVDTEGADELIETTPTGWRLAPGYAAQTDP